jgi:2-keto-4-pentenoate hydratase/2-oxohepta-3-ene-1,7-dioic acid hydratase in catechol pathway
MARHIPDEEAGAFIVVYCSVNDMSEHQYQTERGGSRDKDKSDGRFDPIGSWFVMPKESPILQNLAIRLEMDGQHCQDGTRTMNFGVRALVNYIGQFMILRFFDISSSGASPIVGIGQEPPDYLGQQTQRPVESPDGGRHG